MQAFTAFPSTGRRTGAAGSLAAPVFDRFKLQFVSQKTDQFLVLFHNIFFFIDHTSEHTYPSIPVDILQRLKVLEILFFDRKFQRNPPADPHFFFLLRNDQVQYNCDQGRQYNR